MGLKQVQRASDLFLREARVHKNIPLRIPLEYTVGLPRKNAHHVVERLKFGGGIAYRIDALVQRLGRAPFSLSGNARASG